MKNTMITTLRFICFILIFAVACDSGTTTQNGDTTPTLDEKMSDLLLDYCAYAINCRDQIKSPWDTEQDCHEYIVRYISEYYGSIGEAIKDERFVTSCSEDIKAATNCEYDLFNIPGLPKSCDAMQRSAMPLGTACTHDYSLCNIDSFCYSNGFFSTGICSVCTPRKSLGTACTESRECEYPLYCISRECSEPPAMLAVGEECSYSSQCASSLCYDGLCRGYPSEGENCQEYYWYEPICAEPLRCVDNVCTRMETGSLGDDCFGLDYLCQINLYCDPVTEQCSAYSQVGQSCPEPDCALGTYCDVISESCIALKVDGTSCQFRTECKSGFCNDETGQCSPWVCEMP